MPSGPSDCESGIADSLGSAGRSQARLHGFEDGPRWCWSRRRLWRAAQHCRQAFEAREAGREREDASCYSPISPADLLTAAATALVGSMAQDAPKATATSAPPPRGGSIELALSVIKSNADERAKSLANQMLMEAMRKQAEDDGIVIVD